MRFAKILSGALVLSMLSCLDTTDPNANNTGSPPMSATIDGTAWYSTGVFVTPTPTSITLAGANSASNAAVSFVVNAVAPGTYNLGPGGDGNGVVGVTSGQVWASNLAGGSGTVVITTFVGRHVAGTFDFTAVPSEGAAAGTVHITNGKFDVSY